MAQSIAVNTAVASIGRIVTVFFGIVATSLITRYVGADVYGQYALLLSVGAMLQIAADFGLYVTLTRQLGLAGDNPQTIFARATGLRAGLLVVWFVVGAVWIWVAYPQHVVVYLILALGLSAQSLSQLLMGVYQAFSEVWLATIGDVVGRMAQLVCIGGIMWYVGSSILPSSKLLGVSLAFTLGAIVAYGFHVALVPHIKPFRWLCSRKHMRELARVSWPVGALLIVNAIYFRIDIVMLSWWHTSQEVGWYGLAYRIIESLLFFPAMFGGILLPHLTQAVAHARNTARLLIEQGFHVLISASAIVIAVGVVFARDIVVFISGSSFVQAGPLLQVLVVALGIMFIGNLFGFTLVALGRQKTLLAIYIFLAVMNIVLNALFIPRFGAIAAAYTTLATEALATSLAGAFVLRHIPVRIPGLLIAQVGLIAFASVLLGLQIPSGVHILVRLVVVSGVYAAALWFARIIKPDHINLLMRRKPV